MTYKGLSYIITTILITFLGLAANGQQALYGFDGCNFVDELGNFEELSTINPPSCDCGLVTDGMRFDGINDNLIFPEEIDSLMENDFTISMYLQFDETTSQTDILSVRSECGLDSFFAITYAPANELFFFQISQSLGNIETEQAPIDLTKCWHRIVVTKSGLFYNFYINDVLEASILSNGIVNFPDDARLAIANSACLAVNLDRFNGWIDEFEFIPRALSQFEIINSSLNPDKIISNDTTIIAGSPVDIEVGATCANSFTWTPNTTLDDDTILNPTATPDETTTYSLSILNEGGCTTRDTININVIDPDLIDCSTLLLPNAFTPNNDQLNDVYAISTQFLVDDLEYFEIFDRWGAKMWEANSKNDAWDGSFGGSLVNPGMYIYKIKYSCGGNDFVKVDNFSVIR